MSPDVNCGATRGDGRPAYALKGRLPFRAMGTADGMAIVGHTLAAYLPVLWNETARNGMSANLFLAADLRL